LFVATDAAGGSNYRSIWPDSAGATGVGRSARKLGTGAGKPEHDGAGGGSSCRQLERSNFQHVEYHDSYHTQCNCAGETDSAVVL